MRIELVGVDCPVLPDATVGLQRGSEVVDERPVNDDVLRWFLEARLVDGPDFRGPYVHGRSGARFLYLSWLRPPDGMFRRAKLMLNDIPSELLTAEVLTAGGTGLRGIVRLTMPDGSPLCAAVRPPTVTWSAL